MPECGERPAKVNKRRLKTASCRDPPSVNYGIRIVERSLPPQQQQRQSGKRRMTGGIMRLAKYRRWTVNVRVPKWKGNQLWINSEDLEAAQYNADAALYLTGRRPVHFPDAKFDYLPLRLSTGENLTTREKCSAYVAKIAKDPALHDRRKDFKERAQKLILEMVKRPEAVRFLNTVRASPRQAWQPRPEANAEDTDSPFTEAENGTAMEADTPSEDVIQAIASTVTVTPSECGSLVPVAGRTHSVIADDGQDENGTPMEVDSLSEEAIQALAPKCTVDPASLVHFPCTMTSFCMGVDFSRPFIPSFGMNLDEPENFLTSAGQSLGIRHLRLGEKEKEDLVPDNCKELPSSPDKEEEEFWKSIEPLDWDLWNSDPPCVPHSPLLTQATTLPGSGWQSRGTTSGAGAHEALRPRQSPFVSEQMEALRHSGDGFDALWANNRPMVDELLRMSCSS